MKTTTNELIEHVLMMGGYYDNAKLKEAAQRLRELDNLVKTVHSAKGRYHNQIAMCNLYETCGLPFVRPNGGAAEIGAKL